MIMITGGAYQGKRQFAIDKLHIRKMINGADCDISALSAVECIYGYHFLVKRLIDKGIDPIGFTQRFCAENPNSAVIIDEVGSGIIPMEKEERQWRENVGRCGCIIAENSAKVVRMVCGIPMFIKGDAV